ncbi:MAG TPA: hypothetical protein VJS64_01540 [Pyrinomonadaceae bacterium]|nr:hypothetical protein [Pyrinomonadaceae bacterium]
MSPKRIALWFLIISVALSGAFGILVIISGNLGDFEGRVILTTITISAASICALAAGAFWESRSARTLPGIAVALAIFAATLIIIGIWGKISGDEYWKFSATIGVLAIASAQACLISLAQLAPRFAWTRTIALLAIFFLAGLIIFVIYGEVKEEGIFKAMGATAILVAALTIMMPIFHRLSRGDLSGAKAKTPISDQHLFPTVLCPRCGMTQPNSFNQITCTSCGCRFVVTILDETESTRQG